MIYSNINVIGSKRLDENINRLLDAVSSFTQLALSLQALQNKHRQVTNTEQSSNKLGHVVWSQGGHMAVT